MESWQVVVAMFFVLLPLVLMLDFWGDERLTARGRPITRAWRRHSRPEEPAPQEPAPQEPAPQEPALQEPAPQEPGASRHDAGAGSGH